MMKKTNPLGFLMSLLAAVLVALAFAVGPAQAGVPMEGSLQLPPPPPSSTCPYVDCTPYLTSFTGPPYPYVTNDPKVRFTFSSDMPNTTYFCAMDAPVYDDGFLHFDDFVPCTSPKELAVEEGFHVFYVLGASYLSQRWWIGPTYYWYFWEDNTAPTVESVSPTESATDVGLNSNVTATFSDLAVDPSTVTNQSFALTQDGSLNDGSPVAARVSYDSDSSKATLDPDSALEANTTYTATITTSVKDLAENALAQDYSWTFTTTDDVTAPSTTPALSPQPNAAGWNKGTSLSDSPQPMMTQASRS